MSSSIISSIVTSTPHGPRPGTGSTTMRRNSVDDVLAKEVQDHTFSGVSVRDFFEHAFGFGSEAFKSWLPKVKEWIKSSEDSELHDALSDYRAKMDEGPETELYPPFAKLANTIVEIADEIDKGGNPLRIQFESLGDVYISSRCGKRKPDLLTLPTTSDVMVPSWPNALVVWEFKRASLSNKRKDLEGDSDRDPFIVSSEKRRKTGNGGRGERISSRSRVSTSESKASTSASILSTSNILRESKIKEYRLPSPTNVKVQLASYVAEIFSSDTFREWAFGVTVDNKGMIIRYYDRTCIVESISFKYMDEDLEDFIFLILALRQCDWNHYGFSRLFQYRSIQCHRSLPGGKFNPPAPIEQTPDDTVERLKWGTETQVYINETLHRTYGIFGRSTVVCKVKIGRYAEGEWINQSSEKKEKEGKEKTKKKKKKKTKRKGKRKGKSKSDVGNEVRSESDSESESEGEQFVIKASWQVKTRKKEEEIIREARKINSVNTPAVYFVYSHKTALPSEKLLVFFEPEKTELREDRCLRFIAFRQYKPLYLLEGEVYKKAFFEIVRCHWQLYKFGNILHRDLSILNLMYWINEMGEIVGILNDFDLAIVLNDDKSSPPPSSKHRTGTAPFMAFELLAPRQFTAHLYRHDLESFLYVLVWTAMGYKGFKAPRGRNPLESWRVGDWTAISRDKCSFTTNNMTYNDTMMDNVIEEYLSIKETINQFRSIIATAFQKTDIAQRELTLQLRSKYPSLTTDVIERTDEVRSFGQDMLSEAITWEKVSHLFDFEMPNQSDSQIGTCLPVDSLNPLDGERVMTIALAPAQ